MQYGVSQVARRETTMATTTAMMARHMTRWIKTMRSTTTKAGTRMELAMIRAIRATPAVAGMETLVPFHVAVRGEQVGLEDQAGQEAADLLADLEEADLLMDLGAEDLHLDLEAADLHHHPHRGEVVRVHRHAGTRCCLLIQ